MLDSPSPRSTGSRLVAAAVIGIAALAIAPLRLAARPAAVDAAIEPAAPPATADLHGAMPEPRSLAPTPRDPLTPDAAQKERDLNFVMFLDDDHSTMSGSSDDIQRAKRYRRAGEQILWFRHGGREYVTRDRRILDQVINLWDTGERARQSTGRSGGQAGRARRQTG